MRNPYINVSLEFRNRLVKVIKDESFFERHLSDANLIIPQSYKTVLDNINGFVVISNYTTGLYEYVSEGVRSHLGYDLSEFSPEQKTSFMFSIIDKNHADFILNRLLPTVFKYFKENSTFSTGTDYRYTCCVKIKNCYDAYHWYLIDTMIIEVDPHGFPLRTLITCTNISQFKKDECVYYNIMKKNSDGIYELVLEGADKNIAELRLTPREIQIINLIVQGETNKQIADKLFISLNTVQTHRKSIMKKTQCTGTAELVNFAFSKGLL
jgi:DNA-binding CsgD family transcriptional regulator